MVMGTFGLIATVCAVLVIVDVWTKQKKMDDAHKIMWTVLAVVFSIVTAIIYYFMVKKK